MKDLSEQASRFLDFRVFSNPRSENSRAGRFGVERVGRWGGSRSRRRKSNIPPVNPLNLSRCLNEEGPVGEDVRLTEKGTKKKRKEEKKKTKLRKMSSHGHSRVSFSVFFFFIFPLYFTEPDLGGTLFVVVHARSSRFDGTLARVTCFAPPAVFSQGIPNFRTYTTRSSRVSIPRLVFFFSWSFEPVLGTLPKPAVAFDRV